jgi:hypothetical protein
MGGIAQIYRFFMQFGRFLAERAELFDWRKFGGGPWSQNIDGIVIGLATFSRIHQVFS